MNKERLFTEYKTSDKGLSIIDIEEKKQKSMVII